MAKITLTTKDNLRLSALWWDSGSARSVLLLHMMPATKESWANLAEKLVPNGLNVLAVDFRGHGESEGGDFQKFSSAQHREYYTDAETAMEFLQEKYPGGTVYLGGASIGANIVVKYMAGHKEATKGFALSPGLDYHGIKAEQDIQNLRPGQKILLVGSLDDGRESGNCGEMAEQLYNLAPSQKEKIVFQTGGHGTDMLSAHPELEGKIADYLLNSRP